MGESIALSAATQQILFHDQTEETDGDRLKQRKGWPVTPDRSPPRALGLSRSILALAKNQRDQGQNGH